MSPSPKRRSSTTALAKTRSASFSVKPLAAWITCSVKSGSLEIETSGCSSAASRTALKRRSSAKRGCFGVYRPGHRPHPRARTAAHSKLCPAWFYGKCGP
jgi:hypothetical protein